MNMLTSKQIESVISYYCPTQPIEKDFPYVPYIIVYFKNHKEFNKNAQKTLASISKAVKTVYVVINCKLDDVKILNKFKHLPLHILICMGNGNENIAKLHD